MREYFPLLLVGGTIGVFSLLFMAAWAVLKKTKLTGYNRHMSDGQIIRRLLSYAKPYWKQFLLAFIFMVLVLTVARFFVRIRLRRVHLYWLMLFSQILHSALDHLDLWKSIAMISMLRQRTTS